MDALAERAGIRITRPEAKSYVGLGKIAGTEVVLAKPQTMMNLSGAAVRMLLENYDCKAAEMIVLSDEAMLPWGMLRIRERGSAGGHNGLKSIIASLGTNEFIRVRLGVTAGISDGRHGGLRSGNDGQAGARNRGADGRVKRPKLSNDFELKA